MKEEHKVAYKRAGDAFARWDSEKFINAGLISELRLSSQSIQPQDKATLLPKLPLSAYFYFTKEQIPLSRLKNVGIAMC